MRIGEIARRSGLSRDTLRYYERIGLLAADGPARGPNGYRRYPERALRRLEQVRALKEHGFTLGEIRGFLAGREGARSCEGVPEALAEKLRAVDAELERLRALRERLEAGLSACEGADCRDAP